MDRTRLPAPDMVRERLRKAIVEGELKGGAHLRQDELAERFGTSRVPVREALRQLEAEGLVIIHPNRGAVVAELSLDDALEMLDIRIGLECRALRLAIPNMAEADLAEAEDILVSYDNETSPFGWSEMNWQFHHTLYAPAERPRLLALIEANFGHLSRFTRVQVSLATGKEQPQREHHLILDACRSGNIEEAVRLLEDHITRTQKSLMAAHRRTVRR